MSINSVADITALEATGVTATWGTASLTNATELTIETGLNYVASVIASVESAAATPGTVLQVDVPDQTAVATRGKIKAKMTAATGTTIVSWLAFGYGGR